jgi:hypothetical protein
MLESKIQLREALQSGDANSANGRIGGLSLLELAVGWPDGVRILLEFGADIPKNILKTCSYGRDGADVFCCDDYCDSIIPLLQGGCDLKIDTILSCQSRRARSPLINEFANRRKALHDMAQSFLPPARLAEILGNVSNGSLLDVHAPQVYTELINNGCPIHHSLLPCDSRSYKPLYHEGYYNMEA